MKGFGLTRNSSISPYLLLLSFQRLYLLCFCPVKLAETRATLTKRAKRRKFNGLVIKLRNGYDERNREIAADCTSIVFKGETTRKARAKHRWMRVETGAVNGKRQKVEGPREMSKNSKTADSPRAGSAPDDLTLLRYIRTIYQLRGREPVLTLTLPLPTPLPLTVISYPTIPLPSPPPSPYQTPKSISSSLPNPL